MPFGVATVLTNVGKGITAKRMIGASPSQNEPKYVALGVGATGAARTAVAGDTALSSELAEGRTAGTSSTVTTTQTDDTYQVVGSVTAGGSRAVDEGGLFDASSVGNMFLSATFNVVNLSTGDSLQVTAKVQYT
jgi:hypothetical protein